MLHSVTASGPLSPLHHCHALLLVQFQYAIRLPWDLARGTISIAVLGLLIPKHGLVRLQALLNSSSTMWLSRLSASIPTYVAGPICLGFSALCAAGSLCVIVAAPILATLPFLFIMCRGASQSVRVVLDDSQFGLSCFTTGVCAFECGRCR